MQGFAVLVLGGLTFLGYRVLDGGTRGHFTGRLRVVSLAAFVAATTVTLWVTAQLADSAAHLAGLNP